MCFWPEPRACQFTCSSCLAYGLSQVYSTPIRVADQPKDGCEAMKYKWRWHLPQAPARVSFGSLAFWFPVSHRGSRLSCVQLSPCSNSAFSVLAPCLSSTVCGLCGHPCLLGGAMVLALMFFCLVLAAVLLVAAHWCTLALYSSGSILILHFFPK